jgi:hypothetical protein
MSSGRPETTTWEFLFNTHPTESVAVLQSTACVSCRIHGFESRCSMIETVLDAPLIRPICSFVTGEPRMVIQTRTKHSFQTRSSVLSA